MAIFGGLIGYYMGVSSGASQMLNTVNTIPVVQTK